MALKVEPSLPGLAAVRFAVDQARARRASLWAVRVWRLDVGPRSRPSLEWERTVADEAHRCVDDAFRNAVGRSPRQVGAVVRTPSGRTDLALQDYVTSDGDLLVVGAATSRWWGSGTIRGCVRGAECPVIVVPPPAMARTGRLSGRRIAREAAAELTQMRPRRGR